MTSVKKYSTIRSKSNKGFYAVFVIVVILSVTLVTSVFLISIVEGITNISDNAEVGASASVSGNDVVVNIIDRGGEDKLVGVSISLSGSELSEEESYQEYSSKRMVFKNACRGVIGDKHLFVFGHFTNGERKAIFSAVLSI